MSNSKLAAVATPIAITDRYLFKRYENRADYKARTGNDAPMYNPAYPLQYWEDSSAAGKPTVSYSVLAGTPTQPVLRTMTMPGDEAAHVNLPGTPNYPQYIIAPTQAVYHFVLQGHSFPDQPVDPSTLSTRAEADALASACGGTVFDFSVGSAFMYTFPNTELRRPFKIVFGFGPGNLAPSPAAMDSTRSAFAGQIIQQVNRNGVGRPGMWDKTMLSVGLLAWVPNLSIPDGAGVTNEIPQPVQLNAGETLAGVLVGPGIYTTMVIAAGSTAPGGPGSDPNNPVSILGQPTSVVGIDPATGVIPAIPDEDLMAIVKRLDERILFIYNSAGGK